MLGYIVVLILDYLSRCVCIVYKGYVILSPTQSTYLYFIIVNLSQIGNMFRRYLDRHHQAFQ
jgi:hypothetical protein